MVQIIESTCEIVSGENIHIRFDVRNPFSVNNQWRVQRRDFALEASHGDGNIDTERSNNWSNR